MSDCPLGICDGFGNTVIMMMIAGEAFVIASDPCPCQAPRDTLPSPPACVTCEGEGTVAPHPATMGADAGIDDPCPHCRP